MATIKKISLNGTTYDLGGGLTEDVKQASLQIAEKVAYIDEHGQDYYDELYTAFYDNMWNVTNTLSNAVNSNTATKTAKDGTYTAIISANTGYTLDGATVSVTMGGANVTSAVYSNGTITIPAVTGDVVITVVAVALTVVSISAVYTQSGTVYDTDTLDSLKADLVVTATFNDSSTEVVPSADYTLSGTLERGTSVITVEYRGLTTEFGVIVTGALYPLASGTHTFSSSNQTITVTNGNHIKMEFGTAASSTAGYTINLSNLAINGSASNSNTGAINNQSPLFNIPNGATVTATISNITKTRSELFIGGTASTNQFLIGLRKANLSSSFPNAGVGYPNLNTDNLTTTFTASEGSDIGCLFAYFALIKDGSVEFDYSLVVNGVRYI